MLCQGEIQIGTETFFHYAVVYVPKDPKMLTATSGPVLTLRGFIEECEPGLRPLENWVITETIPARIIEKTTEGYQDKGLGYLRLCYFNPNAILSEVLVKTYQKYLETEEVVLRSFYPDPLIRIRPLGLDMEELLATSVGTETLTDVLTRLGLPANLRVVKVYDMSDYDDNPESAIEIPLDKRLKDFPEWKKGSMYTFVISTKTSEVGLSFYSKCYFSFLCPNLAS